MDKVLAFSKKLLKEVIDKNSVVVDATAGNGNDTLFLAKTSAKKVYSFDIQKLAIENTTRLIEEAELSDKCKVILDSHFKFDKYIGEKILVYWGHENGKVEREALLNELQNLDQKEAEVLVYQFINQKNNAPFIIAIEKRKEISCEK